MADQLSNIERQVLKQTTGGWARSVAAVKEAIILLYSPFFGVEMTAEQIALVTMRVLQLLRGLSIDPRIDEIALKGIIDAHAIGLKIAADGSFAETLPNTAPSEDSKRSVIGMAERAQDAVRQAEKNLSDPAAASTFEGLIGAIKPVLDSPRKMEMAVGWALNNAKNQAIADVAAATGDRMVWVPERDACIHCTQYAGEVAGPEGFPKGLNTFTDKPIAYKGFLKHPPLHPNCRCDIELNLSDEYIQALKREAIRSVLRGTKLPSESETVRLKAAQKLLDQDPVAPASVKKFAEKAVNNGSFTGKKKPAPKPKAPNIEGKDFRSMTNAEKLLAAEKMYGKNSKQYKEALKRFGKK